MNNNQKGFGAVEALLMLVIAGIIGGVGYYVYNANKPNSKSATSQQVSSKSISDESAEAPEIKSSADLDKAAKALDQADNGSDLNEATSLEKEVNNL